MAAICVLLQLVTVPYVLPSHTPPLPWLVPKFDPVIVTAVPPEPEFGETLVTAGTVIVNVALLLAAPFTVTTTEPVIVPGGTAAVMLATLQPVTAAAIPLKATVLLPWLDPKFDPLIVTTVPIVPELGDNPLTLGGGTVTVNAAPLLATAATVTTTEPVVAPTGTVAVMPASLQFVAVAAVPLNATVLVPWLEPKFDPLMVTAVPTGPDAGDKLVIEGGTVTVKLTPLLAKPPTVTTTEPVVAPTGTVAVILAALQLVTVAAVPLKATVLVPWLVPKFDPLMVMAAPTAPELGERLVIEGGTVTVKLTPLLATPPTVTTTEPVVAPVGTFAVILAALQLVTVAVVPLKATVLLPWLDPKFDPLIVTAVPTGPEFGDTPVIEGGGTVTVKVAPLLAAPPTVITTEPVVAPVGTVVVMLAALQLVTVAAVPLKATVLFPWLGPKFDPLMVTAVPTGPEPGARPVIEGGGRVTVNVAPLLATPPTVTTTAPVVAPAGTVAVTLLAFQLVTVAAVPLKVTVLLPWLDPKFDPLIVTAVPITPEAGDKLVTKGEIVQEVPSSGLRQ